jgi:Fe2+ or Zn2+ uptake regulation protein
MKSIQFRGEEVAVEHAVPLEQKCSAGHKLAMLATAGFSRHFVVCDPCGKAKEIDASTADSIERSWERKPE